MRLVAWSVRSVRGRTPRPEAASGDARCGPFVARLSRPGSEVIKGAPGDSSSELVVLGGAGDRDRTGMTSLEGWGSTIELRPRSGLAGT
jgi:hypothetical protein